MPSIEITAILLVLLGGAALFYLLLRSWNSPPQRVMEDPRPELKFASVSDYVKRGRYVPLLHLLNIAMYLAPFAITLHMEYVMMVTISHFHAGIFLAMMTRDLQHGAVWTGSRLITREKEAAAFAWQIRQNAVAAAVWAAGGLWLNLCM